MDKHSKITALQSASLATSPEIPAVHPDGLKQAWTAAWCDIESKSVDRPAAGFYTDEPVTFTPDSLGYRPPARRDGRRSAQDLCLQVGHYPTPERIDETGAEIQCIRCGLRWHEARDGSTTVH